MTIPDTPQQFVGIQPSGTLAQFLTYAYENSDPDLEARLSPVWASLKHRHLRGYQLCAGLALEAALDLGPRERLTGLAGIVKALDGYTGRHFLHHMATGSGKTLLIAAAILAFYQRGYRRFVFLVNQTSILDKTRYNLLPALNHRKCEFGIIQPLADGFGGMHTPRILEAPGRFFHQPGPDIEILFTTIHDLHNQITIPTADGVALGDLASNKMILIGDEAHHFNATTRKGEIDPQEATWEQTIEQLIGLHPDNRLIEFSATIDMENKAIRSKYAGRLVFDLPLRVLRELGYSKNVELAQSSAPPLERVLAAVIASQFRAQCAQDHAIALTPRVLVKSTGTVADLETFAHQVLSAIGGMDVALARRLVGQLTQTGTSPALSALFHRVKILLEDDSRARAFVDQVKANFGVDNALIYHSKLPAREFEAARSALLKIDHDPDRRLLFAVNALNEGIDILSLFDIVKIDDDAKTGKSSTAEVQLIGRGARYFPIGEGEDRYVRKHDADPESELACLETMSFHSAHDNAYINTIRAGLVKSGLIDEAPARRLEPATVPEWAAGAVLFGNPKNEFPRRTISNADHEVRGHEIVFPIADGSTAHSHSVNLAFVEAWRGELTRALRKFPMFDPAIFRFRFNTSPLELLATLSKPFSITCGHVNLLDAPIAEQRAIIRSLANSFQVQLGHALRKHFGVAKLSVAAALVQKDGGDGVKVPALGPIITNGSGIADFTSVKIAHYPLIPIDSGLEGDLVHQLAERLGNDPERFWLVRNPGKVRLHRLDDAAEFRVDFILLRNDGLDANNRQKIAAFYIEAKGEHMATSDDQEWKQDHLTDFVGHHKSIEHNGIVYTFHGMPFFGKEQVVKSNGAGEAAWKAWVDPILSDHDTRG